MLRNMSKVDELSQSVMERPHDVVLACGCMLQHICSTFTAQSQTLPKTIFLPQKSISSIGQRACKNRLIPGGYV